MKNEKYDILIVDEDNDRRMRLKGATVAANLFGDVQLCKDYKFAISKLREGKERMIVCVGGSESKATLDTFLKQAKGTSGGQDSVYIVSFNGSNSSEASIAKSVLDGIDGVLLEPFSVDSLQDVTNLAAAVYQQRRRAREEAAVKCLVESVLKNLDTVSCLKAMEEAPGEAMKALKEFKEVLQTLDPGLQKYYYSMLIQQSEASVVPPELTAYKERRAIEEAKALERLEAKMERMRQEQSAREEAEKLKAKQTPQRVIRRG